MTLHETVIDRGKCREEPVLLLSAMSASNDDERECALVNFRPAKGLRERVYRCGTTDALASVVDSPPNTLTTEERIFLHDITLNIDLRSKGEVDLDKAATWTSRAPGGPFDVVQGLENVNDSCCCAGRTVIHCDLISNVFKYIDAEWLNDVDPIELKDHGSAMRHRMSAITNNGGLAALFQVILEANHDKLNCILKIITVNLEKKNAKIIVNCTQGKDRTGLVTMLLQSAVGVEEKDIVSDFFESHGFDQSRRGSAAMQAAAERFKIDANVLSGAPPEVMERTLAFLAKTYGSVCPGFLDEIGFEESWRTRLVTALDSKDDTCAVPN